MKKIILGIALVSLVMSCQKIQAGSNKGVLKLGHDVERYSDDEMSDEAAANLEEIQASKKMPMDSTKVAAELVPMVKKDSVMEIKTPEAPIIPQKK